MLRLPDETKQPGAPLWMLTLCDLTMLMLGFFLLVISFSSLEEKRFAAVSENVRSAFGNADASLPMERSASGREQEQGTPSYTKAQIYERASALTQQSDLGRRVTVSMESEGVRLRIEGELAFDAGSAQVKGSAASFLEGIAKIIRSGTGEAIVEGHTDDRPIDSPVYPSNWELSGARAGSVVRFLETRGVPPQRMQALGLGASRPIADNGNPSGRQTNRRVEIFLRQTETN